MEWLNNPELLNSFTIIWIPFSVLLLIHIGDKLWLWLNRKKHYELGFGIGQRGDYWEMTMNKYVAQGMEAGYKEYKMIKLLTK